MTARLISIRRYPVKSCRGEELTEAVVEPWGLAGDRRWMITDPAGNAITAREVNSILLITPEIVRDGLRLRAPHLRDLPDVTVGTPSGGEQTPVALWSSRLTAATVSPDVDAWISTALERPARLVHLDDPTRRPTDPRFSAPTDRVSFADGFPLLMATEESLAALNAAVAERDHRHPPMPMERFRPSIVVAGHPAWAEDDWRRIRIGAATFRAAKGCARCVITTIDPDSGLRAPEPIASLARIRRWDGATWFAVNLIPDSPGATISVGDELEVLDAVSPGDGPIRTTAGAAGPGLPGPAE